MGKHPHRDSACRIGHGAFAAVRAKWFSGGHLVCCPFCECNLFCHRSRLRSVLARDGDGVLFADRLQHRRSCASVGVRVASLDKRTAGKNVAITALASVFLSLVLLLASAALDVSLDVLKTIARALSALFLVAGLVRFSNIHRERQVQSGTALIRFYASRMLIGVGIGVLGGTNVGPISPTMVVVAAVAVFSFMLFCIRAKDNLYGFLPVMPLVLAGLLFLPFFDEGSRALSKIASTVIWLVWIFLSSFQLSGLKETFGLSETRLCFSEKAVVLTGWLVGMVAAALLSHARG